MSIATAIEKIRQAGFVIEADGDHIAIEPFDELTVQQIEWLRACKPDILDALRSEAAILDAGQAGNDIEAANDDRALIHVPNLGLADGRRISCDMTVPVKNLDRLRAVIKFTLKDDGGGGSLLGSPGKTEAELQDILCEKYGDRLATIDGKSMEAIMQADTGEGRHLRRLLAKEATGKPMGIEDSLLLQAYRLRDQGQIPDWITPLVCKDITGQQVNHPAMDGDILDGEFSEVRV